MGRVEVQQVVEGEGGLRIEIINNPLLLNLFGCLFHSSTISHIMH